MKAGFDVEARIGQAVKILGSSLGGTKMSKTKGLEMHELSNLFDSVFVEVLARCGVRAVDA